MCPLFNNYIIGSKKLKGDFMKNVLFLSFFFSLLFPLSLFAQEQLENAGDDQTISTETRTMIAEQATKLGYDLSSPDGRHQFMNYAKQQRETLAKAQGIDLSTEDGKKKYKEYVKNHLDQIAKEQNFDLKTKDGRDALRKYLVANGEVSLLPPGQLVRNQNEGKHLGHTKQKNQERRRNNQGLQQTGSSSGTGGGSGRKRH